MRSSFSAHRMGGCAAGSPTGAHRSSVSSRHAEAILALSGTTNGALALEGFHSMEKRTGVQLADLAGPRSGERVTFEDVRKGGQRR